MGSPRGCIVLAAYQPDPLLFARQVRSLLAQTEQRWGCVIAVDGDDAPVRAVLDEIVGDDPRFVVLADGKRRGFYLNFEWGLRAVPEEAAWVALCDQDDEWYPGKLALLIGHLDDAPLVSGQARLVAHPSGTVLGITDRAYRSAEGIVLANQVTGSLCVFRRDLLHTALPFPRVPTRVATHDHWIAVVALTYGTPRIVGNVVQDYVQHDRNVYGDPSRQGPKSVGDSIRDTLGQAKASEGSASPLAVLRMFFLTYVGWRQVMVALLRHRGREVPAIIERAFGPSRRVVSIRRVLRAAQADGGIVRRSAAEYWFSWVAGAVTGGRRRAQALASGSRDSDAR